MFMATVHSSCLGQVKDPAGRACPVLCEIPDVRRNLTIQVGEHGLWILNVPKRPDELGSPGLPHLRKDGRR